MTEPEFLTVKEVAEKIRKSPRLVRLLCAQGALGATRPDGSRAWLIPQVSLDEYLKIRR